MRLRAAVGGSNDPLISGSPVVAGAAVGVAHPRRARAAVVEDGLHSLDRVAPRRPTPFSAATRPSTLSLLVGCVSMAQLQRRHTSSTPPPLQLSLRVQLEIHSTLTFPLVRINIFCGCGLGDSYCPPARASDDVILGCCLPS
jgi:hypothetical protein